MAKKETKNFYAGSVESASAQKMLARISKASKDKPLVAKRALKGQYPNRVARMLADLGLVATAVDEKLGRVFFPKAQKSVKA